VCTWPPERQADIAHVAELMEEQDRSSSRLTVSNSRKCAAGGQKRTPQA
jgi:hypothetical protein